MAWGVTLRWRRQREGRWGGGVWSAEVKKFEANHPWQLCPPTPLGEKARKYEYNMEPTT